jgi:predicted flap endonuclease-1-like 5' DNA nuclease
VPVAWFILQSLLVIVSAFVLGLAVGWLTWGRRAAAGVPHGASPALDPAAPRTENTPAADLRSIDGNGAKLDVATDSDHDALDGHRETESAGRDGAHVPAVLHLDGDEPEQAAEILELPQSPEPQDDLERIEGIGPRIAQALRASGIVTFEHLAACTLRDLQAALDDSGLRFAPSLPTWPLQARLLADGDEEGHRSLTQSLLAGRERRA